MRAYLVAVTVAAAAAIACAGERIDTPRTVFLCWRLGEPSVSYWHETDAGYAGRQPLSPLAVA